MILRWKSYHVGPVHLVRHPGALARPHATGSLNALEDQIRQKDASMTLHYMKTRVNPTGKKPN